MVGFHAPEKVYELGDGMKDYKFVQMFEIHTS